VNKAIRTASIFPRSGGMKKFKEENSLDFTKGNRRRIHAADAVKLKQDKRLSQTPIVFLPSSKKEETQPS
jgi:hypothetical protein